MKQLFFETFKKSIYIASITIFASYGSNSNLNSEAKEFILYDPNMQQLESNVQQNSKIISKKTIILKLLKDIRDINAGKPQPDYEREMTCVFPCFINNTVINKTFQEYIQMTTEYINEYNYYGLLIPLLKRSYLYSSNVFRNQNENQQKDDLKRNTLYIKIEELWKQTLNVYNLFSEYPNQNLILNHFGSDINTIIPKKTNNKLFKKKSSKKNKKY